MGRPGLRSKAYYMLEFIWMKGYAKLLRSDLIISMVHMKVAVMLTWYGINLMTRFLASYCWNINFYISLYLNKIAKQSILNYIKMVHPTAMIGEKIHINDSMISHSTFTIWSSVYQNANREAPARPLNMIWVLDIGSAKMVTFIMIRALDIRAQPSERKPWDYSFGLL